METISKKDIKKYTKKNLTVFSIDIKQKYNEKTKKIKYYVLHYMKNSKIGLKIIIQIQKYPAAKNLTKILKNSFS